MLLSENKPSSSSPVYSSSYPPSKAFDGILTPDQSFVSSANKKPWLQVDLLNVYKIYSVKIYIWQSYTYRMQLASITVSDSNDMQTGRRTCAEFDQIDILVKMHYCIDSLQGRYVAISTGPFEDTTGHYLAVAEMQVYGWQ